MDLAGALAAAALAGFTLGWWLGRRQRAGRLVYLEWSTDANTDRAKGPDNDG